MWSFLTACIRRSIGILLLSLFLFEIAVAQTSAPPLVYFADDIITYDNNSFRRNEFVKTSADGTSTVNLAELRGSWVFGPSGATGTYVGSLNAPPDDFNGINDNIQIFLRGEPGTPYEVKIIFSGVVSGSVSSPVTSCFEAFFGRSLSDFGWYVFVNSLYPVSQWQPTLNQTLTFQGTTSSNTLQYQGATYSRADLNVMGTAHDFVHFEALVQSTVSLCAPADPTRTASVQLQANFTIAVSETAAAELVDPVPSLLSALSAQDTNALTTGGRVVQGVAADGVAEVLVRIPVSTPGAIVSLTLQNDQGNTSSSPEDDGVLTSIDGLQSGSAFQVPATNGSNPMAFALYRAPTDFARTTLPPGPVTCGGVTGTDDQLSCRHVSIRADDLTSGTTATTSVTILRPPVVLIHGIWSSQSTWDFFLPLVTGSNSSDPRFHIYRIDYSQQAGDSVDSIERGALDQLMGIASSFKAAFSVAAVQADVVAHSMGGLVARDMVLDPRFSAAENFSQGFIHKLITIGTPHNGSQLATKLLASSSLCKGAFGLLGKPVSGGVTDMSIGNSFLNFLNNASRPISLRAHAIVGTASVAQELASQIGFDSIVWGVSQGLVCSSLLPPIGGYESLFGGPSDLLVSAPSQSFGFNPSAVSSPSENMIHTVAPIIYPLGPDELNRDLSILGSPISHSGTPVNPDLVLGLLNTPIGSTSNAFVAIHP